MEIVGTFSTSTTELRIPVSHVLIGRPPYLRCSVMRLSGPADFFSFTACSTSWVVNGTSRNASSFWKVAEIKDADGLISSSSAGFVSTCDWHGSESDGTTLPEVAMGHVNVCTGISHASGECGSRVVHWF